MNFNLVDERESCPVFSFALARGKVQANTISNVLMHNFYIDPIPGFTLFSKLYYFSLTSIYLIFSLLLLYSHKACQILL